MTILFQALFRNILPKLIFALAMTEKHEKTARKKIMEEHQCTEIEAALKIAKNLTYAQKGHKQWK